MPRVEPAKVLITERVLATKVLHSPIFFNFRVGERFLVNNNLGLRKAMQYSKVCMVC